MGKRIFSTILLWTVILGGVRVFGQDGGVWLITLVSVLTQYEFYQMLRRMGLQPFDWLGLALGVLITLAPCYFPDWASPEILFGLAVVVCSLRIIAEREPHDRVETLAWTMFGLVYVPFMLQFMVKIVMLHEPRGRTGLALCIWLIAVSKCCDMGALLTGMAFGRHQMAPSISPKKTWEGVAGGVAFSALIGAAIVHGLPGNHYMVNFPAAFTPWVAAALAVPIAGLTIVSDLVESIIKRRAGTKDSGQTIPGIGGMFDLTDSLILTAPAGFLIFSVLSHRPS